MVERSDYQELSDLDALPREPLVSVYMLAYRHERFLADAIEGVMAQQCDFPLELVIGEDCSRDRTLQIAKRYQDKRPDLIRIITSATNVGAKANARRCQAALRGKYVAFCEGDDYWTSPHKLVKQIAILESNPDVTLVCHAARQVDSVTGRHGKLVRPARASRMLSTDEIVRGDGGFVSTCSIVARKTLLEDKPGWWQHAPVGDYPLMLRAAQLGRVAYLDEVMAAYRINVPGSWTTLYREKDNLEVRYQHAAAIQAMLEGFNLETNQAFSGSVRYVTRRYFYEAVARSAGTRQERRCAESSCSSNLNIYDRCLLKLAILLDRRLTRLREFPESCIARLRSMSRDFSAGRNGPNTEKRSAPSPAKFQ